MDLKTNNNSIFQGGTIMKTLILYKSFTKNTEKVTQHIVKILKMEGLTPEIVKIEKGTSVELYNYELVFLGSPVHAFLPAESVMKFIHSQLDIHRKQGDIIPCSPVIPGKYAVCYCTYSGPHTGIREAVPAIKYMEQFFEHLRFSVLDEWYIPGEFRNKDILSTKGVLGDIRKRPDKNDLLNIERKLKNMLEKIKIKSSTDSDSGQNLQGEFIPNAMKFMAENVDFLNNFKKLNDSQKATSSLNISTQTLIKIALAASYKCDDCLQFHIIEALQNGITDIEIKDALFCGAIMGGPPFLSFSFEKLKKLGLT